MPVDTKATKYLWYMNIPEEMCIIRLVWIPHELPISSSMATGKLVAEKQDEETEEWVFVREMSQDMIWVVAQQYARQQEFTVEVSERG